MDTPPGPLRKNLQIAPDGLDRFSISDPHRYSPYVATLPAVALAIAERFDGSRSVAELADVIEDAYGLRPEPDFIARLHADLSRGCFLDDAVYRAKRDAFLSSPTRPAVCAGASYPDEPEELTAFLDALRARPGGPGNAPPSLEAGRLRALISPHIDPPRGGATYAWAWRELAACPARRFVILGTAHYGCGGRFALSRQAYDTPLGALAVDERFLDALLARYDGPEDLLAGRAHHRGEHSIEFQALFLAYAYQGRPPPTIVPVLCGSIHDLLESRDPSEDPAFSAFTEALADTIAADPEPTVLIAGVDFAHVGSQYGQPALDPQTLAGVNRADRETLRRILEDGPGAFHSDLARDANARQICGHAPIAATLAVLDGQPCRGHLLDYRHWTDGRSAVSFAAAAFVEEGEP